MFVEPVVADGHSRRASWLDYEVCCWRAAEMDEFGVENRPTMTPA